MEATIISIAVIFFAAVIPTVGVILITCWLSKMSIRELFRFFFK